MLPWLVLLLPLAAAVLIMCVTRASRSLSAYVSVAAVLASFIGSCVIFAKTGARSPGLPWIDLRPAFFVPLELTLDPLSRSMLILVTGVGALIHIYSLGYMRDDEGKSRYFASLSLFMFAMLGIARTIS